MQIKHLGPWVIGVALLILSACGGTAQVSTDGNTELAFHNWVAGLDLTSGTTADESGLPSIPLDEGIAGRSTAAVHDPLIKLGANYIQMLNGEVDGTSLVLAAPSDGGPDNPPVAYGMYQFEGLAGMRPTSLNVECMPRTIHESYYVGIADYTIMRWRWFGPYTIPEAAIDLSGDNHRFISNLGNMYFLVVCESGNGATHSQTTLLFGDDNNGLPGAPNHLVASDGQFADAVGLTWLPGPGATGYEIFRKRDGDPAHEFVQIGESQGTEYLDSAVDPNVVYLYKVRAVNANGFSGWSNMDPGYAGEAPPPPGNFRIDGAIAFGPDHPAVGVEVTLLGLPHPAVTHTLENGTYHFEGLPAGHYIVVPHGPEIWCDPYYGTAVLNADHPTALVNFNASNTELPLWRAWGFTFAFRGDGWEGFRPLAGTTIEVRNVETQHLYTTTTNADGAFMQMELPAGLYEVRPVREGWNFEPLTLQVHVNGVQVTPPIFFCGAPAAPPPPPGDCVIEGVVLNGEGHGIPGIFVTLLPSPDPSGGQVTDENGGFRFAGLPHGRYIVFPQNPEMMFTPQYVLLDLNNQQSGTAEFHGAPSDATHHLWGFVFNMEGDAPNHFVPMGEAVVKAVDPETGNIIGQASTNHDGFWQIVELPTGMYITHAEAGNWGFDPSEAQTPIDGIHIPPATMFRGILVP